MNCVEQSMSLIDHLLQDGLVYEAPVVTCKSREGVATLEAPRGVLLHAYSYDKEGFLTAADCVIPTAQNLANLEADLRARVPQIIDADPEQFQSELERLVRAYDPCLSCSTHLLTIDRI